MYDEQRSKQMASDVIADFIDNVDKTEITLSIAPMQFLPGDSISVTVCMYYNVTVKFPVKDNVVRDILLIAQKQFETVGLSVDCTTEYDERPIGPRCSGPLVCKLTFHDLRIPNEPHTEPCTMSIEDDVVTVTSGSLKKCFKPHIVRDILGRPSIAMTEIRSVE
jgi:hypothetical protein